MPSLTATAPRLSETRQVPTEVELLERARELVPVLRERAAACEELREVLPETVEDFKSAGFYRILQPAAYGGYEMNPLTHYKVVMEIAKGCPSSAWCLSIVGIHNWEMALLDAQAAEDVWGEDTDVRISSSYAPFGKVEKVDGGYKVSGRWPWSSGCDHCTWAFLGGLVFSDGAPPDFCAFLIPRTDYVIEDNWHVLGLKGTGSKIVYVKDAFVPDYRVHHMAHNATGENPGLKTFKAPGYRYPFGVVFVSTLATAVLGMADGAQAEFAAQMTERRGIFDGAKANENPFVRKRSADADALIRAAHRTVDGIFTELDSYIEAGETVPVAVRVQQRWETMKYAQSAVDAIDLLFRATGGRGGLLSNPMQRFFRDGHMASNHLALDTDMSSQNPGQMAMGGENTDFNI